MQLETEWSSWRSGADALRVFAARPAAAATALPAIVVIQEVWGVDDHI